MAQMIGLKCASTTGERSYVARTQVYVCVPKTPVRLGLCSVFSTNGLIVWIKSDESLALDSNERKNAKDNFETTQKGSSAPQPRRPAVPVESRSPPPASDRSHAI